ncbi:hypothetical protein [Paenibacillus ehimensis]|uniref:hypothetical protein n=1 Tax=Paenibacillus ehimensis TaxID=79264 RepID=UPI00047035DC|nr:hypothetical protein [Paenibacillus ehimensis]
MREIVTISNIILFILAMAILARVRKNNRNALFAIINSLRKAGYELSDTILMVNYSAPRYKELDELLISKKELNITVIFTAPEWLIATKRTRWEGLSVLNANEISCPDWLRSRNAAIVLRNGSYKIITEVVEFIRAS